MKTWQVIVGVLAGIVVLIGVFILGMLTFPLLTSEKQTATASTSLSTQVVYQTASSTISTETSQQTGQTQPEKQVSEEQTSKEQKVPEEKAPVDPVLAKALTTEAIPLTEFTYNPYDFDLDQATITNGTAKCIGWIQAETPAGLIEVEYHCFACDSIWTGKNYTYDWTNQQESARITNFTIVGEPCEHQKALKNNGYIS
ncbi:hypothetical protein [Candidatus Enterococcus courvalinii]|uniref:Uncharacterized protein n=1 Tax=Candidatus Enterococcus courvalinii TaxID=2815329 RepID=A0ABS3HZW9_9ENTE|nr:hypothetical protein [Enterococcus sp. MSG2901]MBO0482015.1 hypothetical protein [Enterococcus sp. MSG2901]